jgi:hypothetical protein
LNIKDLSICKPACPPAYISAPKGHHRPSI